MASSSLIQRMRVIVEGFLLPFPSIWVGTVIPSVAADSTCKAPGIENLKIFEQSWLILPVAPV